MGILLTLGTSLMGLQVGRQIDTLRQMAAKTVADALNAELDNTIAKIINLPEDSKELLSKYFFNLDFERSKPKEIYTSTKPILNAVLNPLGKWGAVVTEEGVYLFSIDAPDKGDLLKILNVRDMKFAGKNRLLFYIDDYKGGKIQLFDANKRSIEFEISLDREPFVIVVSNDGNYIALMFELDGDDEDEEVRAPYHEVKIFSGETGNLLHELNFRKTIDTIMFKPNDKFIELVSILSTPGTVDILNLNSGQIESDWKNILSNDNYQELEMIIPSPDGSKILIATEADSTKFHVFDREGEELYQISSPARLRFSDDGNLIVGKTGKEITFYDAFTGNVVGHFTFNADIVNTAISRDGKKILITTRSWLIDSYGSFRARDTVFLIEVSDNALEVDFLQGYLRKLLKGYNPLEKIQAGTTDNASVIASPSSSILEESQMASQGRSEGLPYKKRKFEHRDSYN